MPGFKKMIEAGQVKDPFSYLPFVVIKELVNEEWVKDQQLKHTIRIVIGSVIRETFMTFGEAVDQIVDIFSEMWGRANDFTKNTLRSPEAKKVFENFVVRIKFAFTSSLIYKRSIEACNIVMSYLGTAEVKKPYLEYQNEIVKLEGFVKTVILKTSKKIMHDLKLDPSFEYHHENNNLKASVKKIEKLRRDRKLEPITTADAVVENTV